MGCWHATGARGPLGEARGIDFPPRPRYRMHPSPAKHRPEKPRATKRDQSLPPVNSRGSFTQVMLELQPIKTQWPTTGGNRQARSNMSFMPFDHGQIGCQRDPSSRSCRSNPVERNGLKQCGLGGCTPLSGQALRADADIASPSRGVYHLFKPFRSRNLGFLAKISEGL